MKLGPLKILDKIQLGHIATFHHKGFVYEVYHESLFEFKIEKNLPEEEGSLTLVTLYLHYDAQYGRILCDPGVPDDYKCTAARYGKRCHHVAKVEDALMNRYQEYLEEKEKSAK